jgi:hypothetical protein
MNEETLQRLRHGFTSEQWKHWNALAVFFRETPKYLALASECQHALDAIKDLGTWVDDAVAIREELARLKVERTEALAEHADFLRELARERQAARTEHEDKMRWYDAEQSKVQATLDQLAAEKATLFEQLDRL